MCCIFIVTHFPERPAGLQPAHVLHYIREGPKHHFEIYRIKAAVSMSQNAMALSVWTTRFPYCPPRRLKYSMMSSQVLNVSDPKSMRVLMKSSERPSVRPSMR